MQKEVITVVTALLLLSPGMAAQHGSFIYSIDKPWLTEVYVDDYYYGADSIGQCLMRVDYAMEIMVDTVQGTAQPLLLYGISWTGFAPSVRGITYNVPEYLQ